MDKTYISDIFDNKLPWIVRHGLAISVFLIIAVVSLVLYLSKDDLIAIVLLEHFRFLSE